MPLNIDLSDPCNCSDGVDSVEPVIDCNKGLLDNDLNVPCSYSDVVVSLEPMLDCNKTPPIISDFDSDENRAPFTSDGDDEVDSNIDDLCVDGVDVVLNGMQHGPSDRDDEEGNVTMSEGATVNMF
ncbi:putative unconventional myosin-XVIIIa isoform X5 [Sesbania bispinosa]|nr:putative unconventional myosin-XVIIIa isoform X5 [Sesbania bispinosa]